MLISQAVEGFLMDRGAGDLAERTVQLYRDCLRHFIKYHQDTELSMVTHDELVRFMQFMKSEYLPGKPAKGIHASPSYVDNHWKAIRSFFGWCNKTLKIPRPDLDLPRIKYMLPEIQPYTEEEVIKIVQAVEFTKVATTNGRRAFRMKRPTAIRDKALILLLLDTGMRVGEVMRLKMEDVNLDSSEVRVRPYDTGLKSQSRTLPLGKNTKRALWLYFVQRLNDDPRPGDSVFMLNGQSIKSLFRRLEERTGINNIHAHRFRHTFAICFLRNGGDVFSLKRLLGHKTLEMVQHYLALAHTDVVEAHRRASPVDRWHL